MKQLGKILPLVCVALMATQVFAGASLDVRPAQCPNWVDLDSRGLLAMALVGDSDFNAARVDTATLELAREDGAGSTLTPLVGRRGGIGRLVDVTAPAMAGFCSTYGADGQRDLMLRFGQAAVVEALELDGESEASICLSGSMIGGGSFQACDSISLTSLGAPLRPFGNLGSRPLR